jgi:glycogen operon protein
MENGLSNYFGYNPIAFYAPHSAYASGDAGQQVQEFKTMVRGLHRAGLEVILDVVFNHTPRAITAAPHSLSEASTIFSTTVCGAMTAGTTRTTAAAATPWIPVIHV